MRDDPFIFPRFFKRNAIAMVMSMPMTSFPGGQRDFILWGTASRMASRSTMSAARSAPSMPRFGFLERTAAQASSVEAIMEQQEIGRRIHNFFFNKREWWSKAIAELIQVTFQIRKV